MDQVGETTLYTDGAAGPGAPRLPGDLERDLETQSHFPYLHHQTCVWSAWHDRHRSVCNPAGARPFAGTVLQSFLPLMTILMPSRAAPHAGDQ